MAHYQSPWMNEELEIFRDVVEQRDQAESKVMDLLAELGYDR